MAIRGSILAWYAQESYFFFDDQSRMTDDSGSEEKVRGREDMRTTVKPEVQERDLAQLAEKPFSSPCEIRCRDIVYAEGGYRLELYSPSLRPALVAASADYEHNLGIDSSPRIVDVGEFSHRGAVHGYIVRERKIPLPLAPGDAVNAQTLLQGLFGYLDDLCRLSSATFGSMPRVHGHLTPSVLFVDPPSEAVYVSGANIPKLAELAGPRLWRGTDAYARAFRAPDRENCPIGNLSIADDIYAACGIALLAASGKIKGPEAARSVEQQREYYAELLGRTGFEELLRSLADDELLPVLSKGLSAKAKERFESIGDVRSVFNTAHVSALRSVDKKAFTGRTASSAGRESFSFGLPEINDEKTKKVLNLIDGPERPVLITGPTGSGKTTLAGKVHEYLYGGTRPFLSLNCASLHPNLILAQLFGCCKGIHSAAAGDMPGLLERVGDGTLFLDEIDQLPAHDQVKLFKVLDDNHEFYYLGGEGDESFKRTCGATLVFATNRDLRDLVQGKVFRRDFFSRIDFIEFKVLPVNHPKKRTSLRETIERHWEQLRRLQAPDLDDAVISEGAYEAFVKAPYRCGYRDIERYMTKSVIHLINTGRKTLSAEDAAGIVNQHVARMTHADGENVKSVVVFERDVADLLRYLEAAEDGHNRRKAAQAIGHVNGEGEAVVARINKLIGMLKKELGKRDIASRRGEFSAEEWEMLERFVYRR